MRLIAFITNAAFYGRMSLQTVNPAENQLGWYVLAIPVVGVIVIGFMARYGSKAIRGHGIPEAMEQVLTNRSRVSFTRTAPARQAADHMTNHDIGRLPVLTREEPPRLVGIVTRSDILSGYRRRMEESASESPTLTLPGLRQKKKPQSRKTDNG